MGPCAAPGLAFLYLGVAIALASFAALPLRFPANDEDEEPKSDQVPVTIPRRAQKRVHAPI